MGTGTLVTYFDRLNLSVAAPQLRHEFGLSLGELGLLFSAFYWSYAVLQIPSGLVLDRFGVKSVGRWGSFLWSVASLIMAFTGGFGGVFIARILLGIAEAPSFPANAKAIGYWFPRHERARSTALFDAASKFSNVIGVPLVAVVVVNLGWRWGFGATALLSFIYFLVFCAIYRDPSEDRKLSAVERQYLVDGGATAEGPSPGGSARTLGYLLHQRKVWGLTIGFACYGYSFYFMLTWLPGYLVETMHQSILTSAGYTAIPWLCATVTDLAIGGWLVDRLIRLGHNESRVRKSVLVGGMLTGLAILGATRTVDPHWAIFWISISLSGLAAAAPVGWSIPALIAPRGATASVGSIMNFANNAMGIASPIIAGAIVGITHSFALAFLVAGAILLLGIASYVYLLGDIGQIPEPA